MRDYLAGSLQRMSATPLMSDISADLKYFQTAVEANDSVVLADNTSPVLWDEGGSQLEVAVVLTANTLILYKAGDVSNPYKRVIHLNSVIGVHSDTSKSYTKATSIKLYQYELIRGNGCLKCFQSKERKRYVHTLIFSDSDQCALWYKKINGLLGNSIEDECEVDYFKKYLVFINPVSGTGHGKHIYDKIVENMLFEARIEIVPIVTERQNHAFDFVKDKSIDMTQFDAVVMIGGDGLIYEVVNGIAERGPDGLEILRSLPLAPIPGGTGNGLAKSVLFECGNEYFSPKSATFVAIKGKPSSFDLSEIATTTEKRFAFLSMSWGLISDLDIRSEWLRCIGEIRLHLAAFYFMLLNRQYTGRLLMHLAEAEGASGQERGGTDEVLPPLFGNDFVAEAPSHLLKIIHGSFQLIWVVQTPFASSSTHSGPGVELNDGILTIFVVQGLSRCELLQLLLDVDSGAHIYRSGVQVYKCHAYRIEPFLDNHERVNEIEDRGIFAVDGESIDGPMIGPVQGRVMAGMARVMKLA